MIYYNYSLSYFLFFFKIMSRRATSNITSSSVIFFQFMDTNQGITFNMYIIIDGTEVLNRTSLLTSLMVCIKFTLHAMQYYCCYICYVDYLYYTRIYSNLRTRGNFLLDSITCRIQFKFSPPEWF